MIVTSSLVISVGDKGAGAGAAAAARAHRGAEDGPRAAEGRVRGAAEDRGRAERLHRATHSAAMKLAA